MSAPPNYQLNRRRRIVKADICDRHHLAACARWRQAPPIGAFLQRPARPLTITFAGRIQQQQKRILDLIELTKILVTKAGSYNFRIVGEGSELGQLMEFFKHVRYSNISCNFLGLIDNERMMNEWTESDVCILFSEYEGMSISMAESMGQGCVPVVTDVSGAREAIVQGKTGFTFPVGALGAAASYLEILATDRLRLEEMSRSCIASIAGHRDFDRYDLEFLSLIQRVTGKQPARWPVDKKIVPDRNQKDAKSRSIYRRVQASTTLADF
jgi:glycogen(starch) synthase